MKPTTAEQRAMLAITGNYFERCLVADIKRLEKDARENAKLCKADNEKLLEVLDELIESVMDVHDGDFGPLERARAVRDAEVKA